VRVQGQIIDRHAVQHGTVEKLHARGALLEPLPD